MEGVIVNFRRGKTTMKGNQMVLVVDGVNTKAKTEKLIGKKVIWKSPGNKEITGKITMPHGNKGAVRVLFEKGMPGQSIGQKVRIE
jgi:large subunit ribosomal protein L35Ae